MRLHVSFLVDFFIRNDAGLQRVSLGLVFGMFIVGADAQDSCSEVGEQNRSEDVFRELHTVCFRCFCHAVKLTAKNRVGVATLKSR